MKLRSDSNLAKLTDDQRDQIIDWAASLGHAEASRRAALPAPDGFGLQLSYTSVVRYYKAVQRERHAEELAARAVVDETNPVIASLIRSARVDFAHAVFDLAQCVDTTNFDRLAKTLHNLDRAEIARETLALKKEEIGLTRERLEIFRLNSEYNIARELLRHAPDYVDIRNRTDLDDENKIWLARDRAFGLSPLAPFPLTNADRQEALPLTGRNGRAATVPTPGRATISERAAPAATTAAPQPENLQPDNLEPAAPSALVDNRGDATQTIPAPAAPQPENLQPDNLEPSVLAGPASVTQSNTLQHTSADQPLGGRASRPSLDCEHAVLLPTVDSRGDTTPITSRTIP